MSRRICIPAQHHSDARSMLVSDRVNQRSILEIADPNRSQPLVIRGKGSQEISDRERNLGSRNVVQLQILEAREKVPFIRPAIPVLRSDKFFDVCSGFDQDMLPERNSSDGRDHGLQSTDTTVWSRQKTESTGDQRSI